METDSPVVYHGTSESRFPQREHQKSGQGGLQQLSAEEVEIFRICNRESLYQRCLPLAVIGIAATHFATKKGFFSSNSMFGPGLKMSGAAVLGWILGKISYRKQCEDKFLHLENSIIGDAIRRRRGYSLDRYKTEGFKTEPQVDDLVLKDDSYSYFPDSDYHSSSGSLNLDVDKNIQYSGLDDFERPSTDRENLEIPEEVVPSKTFTNYEELRRKNRDDYEKSQRSYTTRRDQTVESSAPRPWSNIDTSSVRRATLDSNEGGTRNIYGDTWDNAKVL